MLLSPFTPMLFMGEEYGEPAPFPFFVGHDDPELLEATRQGRRREFRDAWTEEVADPGDPATFRPRRADPSLALTEPHRAVLAAYTELLALRRRHAVLRGDADQTVVTARRGRRRRAPRGDGRAVLVLAFGAGPATVPVGVRRPHRRRSTPATWAAGPVGDVGDGTVTVDGRAPSCSSRLSSGPDGAGPR